MDVDSADCAIVSPPIEAISIPSSESDDDESEVSRFCKKKLFSQMNVLMVIILLWLFRPYAASVLILFKLFFLN